MCEKSERPEHYRRTARPIVAMAVDHQDDWLVAPHTHRRSQLVFAISGVMIVDTESGRWVVPPSRAVWIPAGIRHSNRMLGSVRFRTVYLAASCARHLPKVCRVVAVTPLLRELILEAVRIGDRYTANSRGGRVRRLIPDEIKVMQSLPLELPMPADARARRVGQRILDSPDCELGLDSLAREANTSERQLERLFLRETGMSIGHWRRHARLQASLFLLAKDERILDAALAVGYGSPSAFAAALKKYFGLSPSLYFSGERTHVRRNHEVLP